MLVKLGITNEALEFSAGIVPANFKTWASNYLKDMTLPVYLQERLASYVSDFVEDNIVTIVSDITEQDFQAEDTYMYSQRTKRSYQNDTVLFWEIAWIDEGNVSMKHFATKDAALKWLETRPDLDEAPFPVYSVNITE